MEFLEHTGKCISMKWKAPRDNGGKPVTSFIIERKLVGKKSWIKVGEVDGNTTNFSTNKVDEGKAYQYRIRAVNSEGMSDPLDSDEVFAGEPIGKYAFSLPSANINTIQIVEVEIMEISMKLGLNELMGQMSLYMKLLSKSQTHYLLLLLNGTWGNLHLIQH